LRTERQARKTKATRVSKRRLGGGGKKAANQGGEMPCIRRRDWGGYRLKRRTRTPYSKRETRVKEQKKAACRSGLMRVGRTLIRRMSHGVDGRTECKKWATNGTNVGPNSMVRRCDLRESTL